MENPEAIGQLFTRQPGHFLHSSTNGENAATQISFHIKTSQKELEDILQWQSLLRSQQLAA